MNIYAASVALLWTTAMRAPGDNGAALPPRPPPGEARPTRRPRRQAGGCWRGRAAQRRRGDAYWSVASVSMKRRPCSGSTDSRLDTCRPCASVRLKASNRRFQGRPRITQ